MSPMNTMKNSLNVLTQRRSPLKIENRLRFLALIENPSENFKCTCLRRNEENEEMSSIYKHKPGDTNPEEISDTSDPTRYFKFTRQNERVVVKTGTLIVE